MLHTLLPETHTSLSYVVARGFYKTVAIDFSGDLTSVGCARGIKGLT